MGPPFEDGEGNQRVRRQTEGEPGFNGAAVRKRRRERSPSARVREPGRSFNGAAVRKRRRASATPSISRHHIPSFNGAAVRKRRRVWYTSHCESCLRKLQWGRRSKTAERPSLAAFLAKYDWLQWGRRSKTAEGSLSEPVVTFQSDTRFNGAAVRKRRRGKAITCGRTSLQRLQWGRRSKTAEGPPEE